MMASFDEREIRDAVVARLRELLPAARIVHELNVAGTGTNRIDVAAICTDFIVGAEIKSRKDVLKRLDEQWAAFGKCCHEVIIAAHEKHFVADPYNNELARRRSDLPPVLTLNHPLFVRKTGYNARHIWRYPRPAFDRDVDWYEPWNLSSPYFASALRVQPLASAMLSMLWAEELRAECARHRLASHSRRTRGDMIAEMAWLMTGKEVCHAVCRQLRGRGFAEADPPIFETPPVPAPPEVAA